MQENRLDREDGNNKKIPYLSMTTNDFEKINVKLDILQLKQWPILNNKVNNV